MKKFTQAKQITIKGWTHWPDQGMHKTEFTIDRHGFAARADGEMWDYSEDPNDFVEFIVDGKLYTKVKTFGSDPEEAKIEYTDPIDLSKWLSENLK
jgi:hypothetical protein